MFSSEMKIISIASKEGYKKENSPKTKYNKSQTSSQKNHHSNSNNLKKKTNSNTISNTHTQFSSVNRRKFYHQNNNNSTIKNQNICIAKNAHNIVNNCNGNSGGSNNVEQISIKSTKYSPQQRSKVQLKTVECSSANLKSPLKVFMVMNNNLPQTTQATVTTTSCSTSAPISSAQYSLDFLHSVGVQMTPGANRTYSPNTCPRHIGYTNPQRHNRNPYSQDNSSVAFNENTQNFSTNPRPSFREYHDYDVPVVVHHHAFATRGVVQSPMSSESHNHHQPHGYHSNYVNQYNRSQHNGVQYYNMPSHFAGNSRHTLQHHQPKKVWNSWNPNNKKNFTSNAPKINAAPTINNNESDSSQTLPRTRNHQNFRNLTYVLTDTVKFIGNSRSPTPSPKSESPSLYKTQNSMVNAQVNFPADTAEQECLTAAGPTSSVDVQNANIPSNGYESDSSHSSYQQTEYDNSSKNTPTMAGYHQMSEMSEMSSLLNFPTYSEEDLSHHVHYYGSQQNLSFWNVGLHLNYNPHGMYSASGSGSSDLQYLNDPSRRGQTNHRGSFRGRRSIQQHFRPHFSYDYFHTPPDRFLARAHLIEVKETPGTLLNGSKWDQLSQEIWHKFITCQQTEETYKKKMLLWRYLYLIIKNTYPRYGLYLVGSTISGFGADTSDVDMCLVSRTPSSIEPRTEALFNLTLLRDCLSKSDKFENFNLIEAKVPILRFTDRIHTLEVDLNFNNCVGIKNTHLLHCYSQLDWRLKPLVLVAKLWAQYHNINNAKNMTISSYSLVLMVIHFLQYAACPPVLPCLHEMFPEKFQIILKSNDFGFVDMNECMDPYESQNTQTVGELFLQFLEYFSNFDYSQYAISIRTGSIIPIEICRQAKTLKNDIHQWKELCIEEPFDLTNTARSVYDGETFERVKIVFMTSWKILQETLDLSSIFVPIISTSMSSEMPMNMIPSPS